MATLQHSSLENPNGERNLKGYSPWVHKESDTTEWLSTQIIFKIKLWSQPIYFPFFNYKIMIKTYLLSSAWLEEKKKVLNKVQQMAIIMGLIWYTNKGPGRPCCLLLHVFNRALNLMEVCCKNPVKVTNGVAVLKPFILRLLTISYIQLTTIFSEDIGTLYVWE